MQSRPSAGHHRRADTTGCIASVNQNPAGCTATTKGLRGASGVVVVGRHVGLCRQQPRQRDRALQPQHRDRSPDGRGLPSRHRRQPGRVRRDGKGLLAARSVVASADAKNLYVTGELDNTVVIFNRDTATGALTPAGCIASIGHNSAGCATTAKGFRGADDGVQSGQQELVRHGKRDNAIVRFRNTSTGALTFQGCTGRTGNNPAGCGQTVKGLAGASGTAVSGDGGSVYVTGISDNAIVELSRNTTSGALSPKAASVTRSTTRGDAPRRPRRCQGPTPSRPARTLPRSTSAVSATTPSSCSPG